MAFYEASAQILPVLVLAGIVELYGRASTSAFRELRPTDLAFVLAMTLAFFAIAAAGEAAALSVLLRGRPSELAEATVESALVISSGLLVLGALRPFFRALDPQGHGWVFLVVSGTLLVAQLAAIWFLVSR